MAYNPNNPNGQATSANSAPVVIASDQSIISTKVGDGTNSTNVLKSDGTSAGQNAALTAGAYQTVTGSASTLNGDLISLDVSGYKSFALAFSGTWVGTISFQGSADNSTWFTVPAFNPASTSQASFSSTTANNQQVGPLYFKYFRLRMTSYTSGTASVTAQLSTLPWAPFTMGVSAAQSGTWTVQPGNTANTTAWKVDNSGVTQPISATSLPLPTGAAQDATLTGGTVRTKVTDGTNNAAVKAASTAAVATDPALVVAVSPNNTVPVSLATAPTTPVTGTFWQATQPVSAASLPLPTGAAQDATLTGGTVRTKVTDGTTNAAVKAASTAAVAADPALVVAVSPNNTIPVSLATNTPVIAAGTATIGSVKITDGTNTGTVKAASTAAVATDTAEVVALHPSSPLPAGTNLMGAVTVRGSSSNGATTTTLISAATTNATSVKASGGTLYGVYAYNNGASACYLKLFNLATAPTVGTSVAAMTIMLPAGGGSNIPLPAQGLAFGTGISFSITGGGSTADTAAVAATQVFVNLAYA